LVDPFELFLDIGDDIEIQQGEITTITPIVNLPDEELSIYQWFVNQSSQDLVGFDTLILAPDGGSLIQLVITDNDGCIVADDLFISIVEDDVSVVIANIFNPKTGGFGIEDFADIDLVNQFNIYDRWGQLIFAEQDFHPEDKSKNWNGT